MINDNISDMLTRIRNAHLVKSKTVVVPFTTITYQICTILEKNRLIEGFGRVGTSHYLQLFLKYVGPDGRPAITNLKRISKPGLRVYTNQKEIPKVLTGIGVVILSTSKGVVTGKAARLLGVGGEVLCSIW